ncbi:hypothetical protein C8R43DRAFT_945279 [Mycena crocata]|nr:hypothetical protein C8R43DRAFT_945279 [Mycena crocata]
MKHYVDMIRALGTADGYNTELSERLHIDCAKLGYAASSKKNYINQMTRWLMRRESIDRFSSYLQWAIPGYLIELNDRANDADRPSGEESDSDSDSDDEEDTIPAAHPSLTPPQFTIAKTAPFPRVTVASLEDDYGANDFLSRLEDFLHSESILPQRFFDISATFPVYKRIVIKIPAVVQVTSSVTNDPIRATRAVPSRGLKKAQPAHFDTVLARKEKPAATPKRLSLEGLFAGRVRAIFALPVEYGMFPTPLAYVEWFKPLTQLDPDLGMYKLAFATQAQRRRSSIIPVTQIARSCHLIPRFPRHIDRTLTTDNYNRSVKQMLKKSLPDAFDRLGYRRYYRPTTETICAYKNLDLTMEDLVFPDVSLFSKESSSPCRKTGTGKENRMEGSIGWRGVSGENAAARCLACFFFGRLYGWL